MLVLKLSFWFTNSAYWLPDLNGRFTKYRGKKKKKIDFISYNFIIKRHKCSFEKIQIKGHIQRFIKRLFTSSNHRYIALNSKVFSLVNARVKKYQRIYLVNIRKCFLNSINTLKEKYLKVKLVDTILWHDISKFIPQLI